MPSLVLKFIANCDGYAVYSQYTGLLQKKGIHSFLSNTLTERVFRIIRRSKVEVEKTRLAMC